MTRLILFFKIMIAIVALCLPLGCGKDSPSPQITQMNKHLHTLQIESQRLEKQALDIESQIDEIRRASTETQSEKLETLRIQFNALKTTHQTLQQEMADLRKHIQSQAEQP